MKLRVSNQIDCTELIKENGNLSKGDRYNFVGRTIGSNGSSIVCVCLSRNQYKFVNLGIQSTSHRKYITLYYHCKGKVEQEMFFLMQQQHSRWNEIRSSQSITLLHCFTTFIFYRSNVREYCASDYNTGFNNRVSSYLLVISFFL